MNSWLIGAIITFSLLLAWFFSKRELPSNLRNEFGLDEYVDFMDYFIVVFVIIVISLLWFVTIPVLFLSAIFYSVFNIGTKKK